MAGTAQVVRLTRAGTLPVTADAFTVERQDVPEPAPGEVLVRVHYVSLDPYQRIYLRRLGAGDTPPAGSVGQVVRSRSDEVPEGAWVTGELGWRDHATARPENLTLIEPDPGVPLRHYVGMLGLSGITAYFGVTRVLRPAEGERIVVSGAFGGVGQVAAQLVARAGAQVLGIVGSERKRDALARIGIPSVCHRDPDWARRMAEWAPDGVDGYFDNVWGDTASRVVEQLAERGRIALCGQMTGLADGRVPPLDIDWYLMLTRSLTLRGFRAVDYLADYPAARAELARGYLRGELRQEVSLVDGLGGAGQAFEDLVNARSVGKTIVSTR
jgi:NADPH-dependent curcumin reductase CurA